MADYDLVIIGGSPVGRYAAVRAIRQGAKKVALVEPPLSAATTSLYDVLAPHAIAQLQAVEAQQFLLPSEYTTSIAATEVSQWTKNVVANIEEQNSPAILSALGVDVIAERGEFTSQKPLTFNVRDRQLLARSYLIATCPSPTIPDIEGLHATDYLTVRAIWQQLPTSAKDWAIIGGNPDSVMLAQTLTKLGFNISLIVKRPQIVAGLDADIAQLLQAILEADGIRVLTATSVTQIKQIGQKKWIQAGDRAIEVDEVLICVGCQPNIVDFNLEKVGVKWDRRGIKVNNQLQTTNPRIYACGDVIGGYPFMNIANYEARIAVNNSLLLPKAVVDYRSVPWAIFSQPQVAQVGLNETKAKHFYSDVLVVQKHFKTLAAAHIKEEIIGTCKLVARRNGEILGATIVGCQASELINVISLAIAQKIKLNAIAQLAPIYPSFSEVFE